MESQSIDYPELDRIHKDHQIQLLAFPVQLVDSPQNHTMCIFLLLSFRKEFNWMKIYPDVAWWQYTGVKMVFVFFIKAAH